MGLPAEQVGVVTAWVSSAWMPENALKRYLTSVCNVTRHG